MPARFKNGITTVGKTNPLGEFGLPDPTAYHVYFEDFDYYTAADWTVTETSTSATQALTDADGGVLLITNSTTDNDKVIMNKVGESFKPAVGKKLFFKTRFKLNEVLQSDLMIGLNITDNDALAAGGDGVTDGIFFQKDDGDANVDFYCQLDATTGQLTNTAVTTLTADTWTTLAYYYDGASTIKVYKDDVHVYTADLTTTPTTYLPDTELTVAWLLQQGEGTNAKILSIDYVFVAQER